MAALSSAVYLYCVVRTARRPSLARVPAGLSSGSRPVAHKLSSSLWLITAEVPLDIYGPQHLETRLRDLDWVAEAALAHEAVVEYFSRGKGAVVIPMKLFTMFSSLDKAVADVAARKPALERDMRHIAGSQEWGVRITRRPDVAARASGKAASAVSGAAFLAAKKEARDASAKSRAESLAAADTAFSRLTRYAKDAQQRPRRQEPGTNPPILEAAFLVTLGSRLRFKAEAKRQALLCASAGADLTLTGPWPAYNFIGAPGESA
jgi:Gas vesicle synthesis protein GvpL/GvpF